MYRIIAVISFIAILITFAVWGLHSADYGKMLIFSQDKKSITVTETDDLFGAETTSTEWEDGFWLGLLPGDDTVSFDALIGVTPISGFFIFVILISYFINKKHRKLNK